MNQLDLSYRPISFPPPLSTLRAITSAILLSLALVGACSSPADGPGQTDAGTSQSDAASDAATRSDAGAGEALELIGRGQLTIAGDVAADPARNLVAVAGFSSGKLTLFDVSDPTSPVQLSSTDVGFNADVQFIGTTLYVNHERLDRGIDIYDTTNPANPKLIRSINQNLGGGIGLNQCHNTWPQPGRGLLYCASTASGEVMIMSIGDNNVGSPEAPVYLTSLRSPNGGRGVHDMYARGNRLYIAFLDNGMAIYDITTARSPQLIGSQNYANSFTHNIWPSSDDQYLFTTDEIVGGHLKIWDIQDLNNIQLVSEYKQNDNAIIHNVEIVGERAYISWYTEGLTVLDVSDPTAPTVIAKDDYVAGPDSTPENPVGGFRGAWGVEPVPPYIYVSDLEAGLMVFKLNR